MWFECRVNGIDYKVSLEETQLTWNITIESESGKKTEKIKKKNFQKIENAYSLIHKNKSHWIDIQKERNNSYTVYCKGSYRNIQPIDEALLIQKLLTKNTQTTHKNTIIYAEVPGILTKIFVREKSQVHYGDSLFIIEAMKMENDIQSPLPEACIKKIFAETGVFVNRSEPILELEPV